ncbi:BID domain-containing T4SS effector [Bartonella sp. CB175]|uniref:BID domain-containing T4SS effector n=1 Tax=Bartonella sp. CB175 TaxID=3112256 RepID=UPI00300E4FF8
MAQTARAENYVYPNGVLKNKYDIQDQQALNEKIRNETSRAMLTILEEPTPQQFDSEYLQYINYHLYKNIYDWAGRTRNVPITFQDGTIASMPILPPTESGVHFARGPRIQSGLQQLNQMLAEKNNLKGLSREDFIVEAANIFNHINKLHPFRSGNGHTQRLFLTKLAESAGYDIDFSLVTQVRMEIACNLAAKFDDLKPMRKMLDDISHPQKMEALSEFLNKMIAMKGNGVNNDLVLAADEGVTYSGTYQGHGVDSFAIQNGDTYIVGLAEALSPEQRKTLKIGEKFTFTVPKAKDLEKTLIPAENLAPLVKDDLVKMISEDPRVQRTRQEVVELAKKTFTNYKILNDYMDLVKKIPSAGYDLAERLRSDPERVTRLAGFSVFGLKSPARKHAEGLLPSVISAMEQYTDAVQNVETEIVEGHYAEQVRRGQAIERPNKVLEKLLFVSSETRTETLRESDSLKKELFDYMKKINQRLSRDEQRAIEDKNYGQLAYSLGVSFNKAQEIANIVGKAQETINENQFHHIIHRHRTQSLPNIAING